MAHHPIASWLGVIAFALLMGVATFGVINAFVMRFKQVKLAKRPEIRWDEIPQRIKNVMVYVLGQKRLPRNGYTYSGVLHMFIFGAFVVLSVDTTNFVLDGTFRMFDVILGNQPGGPFHLPGSDGPYQGLADTFRFLCIVGLGMALVNRTIIKPARLPLTRDALYTLAFIFGLMFFEAIQTGAQMALTPGMAEAKPYIWFSGLFASAFSGLETETVALIYKGAWWLHLANLLAFTNYVPYSKHSHVFGAPLNIFFMSLEPKGALRKMEINIEDEENAPEYFGARNLEDLSWKQVFDGLACTECGRCTDNCPAALSGKPLKPMHIIVDLKHHMEDRWKKRGEKFDLAEDGAVLLTTPDNKGIIDPDVLWSCTTCRACMEVCPVGNEHIPAIVDMRRYLTMGQGSVGHGADGALKKMDRRGNPWGMNKRDRVKWADGLDIPLWDAEKPAEYLYWVGCAGAFDNRAQKVTKSVSRLMKKAGVDFAILGNDESCTGDSARRLGDEYLFQNLATQNVETLNSSGVKKIVTHCPHCFNTLKNEYGQFGGQYEVIHHSELLAKLMSEGKLKLDQDQGEQTIIYHDSCYLGRYNEIYDPQRDIIDAMPKVKRIEADRARQRGLCCGAGGGQMWMEMDIGTRMNYVRTDELLAKKPDVIAVACNFCMTMVEDGVKARSKEDEVQVLDLAELLDRRIAADVAAEEATEGVIEPPLPAGPHCPLSTAPLAGVGGEIHNDPEHFEVDELAAYAPSGEGTHWFVQIRKVGLNSVEVRELLAAAAGVDPRDVGMAGRKDRHAITTQWFSLPAPPVDPGEERLTLLQVAQHGQKLRMGHLAGNRFRVRITGVRHPEHLPALVDGLRAGLPNYFGAQRFGRFGLADGLRLLNHPRRRVKDPKFLASVVQSAVFNHWLGARVAAGALHTAIAGDILRKRETGGLFVCAEPDVDGPRVAAGEVDPTGPLPGPKTWAAEADAAVAEAAALDALGLTPDQRHVLGRFADGTRRVARIVPADFTAEPEGDDLVVGFTLPKGAFATVVLGYLIDPTTPFGRTVVGEGD